MDKSTATLASGHEMPLVGFGLWKVPTETCAETVYNVRGTHLPITQAFEC
jgi:D-xylose reductase